MIFVVLQLLIGAALGSAPSCAVLFSFGNETICQQHFAEIWLAAAQAEAARFYHTINGGFLAPDCVGGALGRTQRLVPGVEIPWTRTVCIFRDHLPEEKCHTKKCNFTSHPELFTNEDASMHSRGNNTVRSIRSWIDVANDKLVNAIASFENCDFNASLSFACVADYIFQQVARSLVDIDDARAETPRKYYFLDADARRRQHYNHINGPVQRLTYVDDLNANATFQFVSVQSQRVCGRNAFNTSLARTTSVLLYTNFTGVSGDLTNDTSLDLIYAGTGVIPSFAQGFAGDTPSNDCARRNTPPTFSPPFDENLRLDLLSRSDFAVTDFADGTQHVCADLGVSGTCVIILLRHANATNNRASVTQINLFDPLLAQNSTELQSNITAAVLLVDGDIDVCKEFNTSAIQTVAQCINGSSPTTTTVTVSSIDVVRLTDEALSAEEKGVPLTLAPGESQCVGGERHGARCTMPNECGDGWACRRKPFTAHTLAFCYDGDTWDEERTCAFADSDEECPFGECFGAINGNDGGAYPFFYFFAENNCSIAAAAESNAVCRDEHVARWFNYPNPLYANENYFAQAQEQDDL